MRTEELIGANVDARGADPVRIAPRSRDVPVRHLVGKTAGGPSILAITVEQVLEAWQDLPKR